MNALPASVRTAGYGYPFGVRIANERSVNVVLPYPPSVNRMWRSVNGRNILSREGREYRERVKWVCLRARPLDGDVRVCLVAYRPRRVGDLDNIFKGVLDSLRGIAFHDDKQVVRIEADRKDDKENPRVAVLVTKVETPQ